MEGSDAGIARMPVAAWEFFVGGYQVIKKWLSYREKELLGRPITTDEAREVTAMARRITALVLLGTELDDNYRQSKKRVFQPAAPSTPAL